MVLGSIQKQSCLGKQHGRTEHSFPYELTGKWQRKLYTQVDLSLGVGRAKLENSSLWKKVEFWLILHVGHCGLCHDTCLVFEWGHGICWNWVLSQVTDQEIHRMDVKCWWKNNKDHIAFHCASCLFIKQSCRLSICSLWSKEWLSHREISSKWRVAMFISIQVCNAFCRNSLFFGWFIYI